MTGIVSRLAKQDYDVEVPRDRRRDETGEMNEAIHIFRENGLERDRLDAERRRDQQAKDLILQMMHRLQACQTQDEHRLEPMFDKRSKTLLCHQRKPCAFSKDCPAGVRSFPPLDHKMILEEADMGLGFLEVMRCQNHRQDRHVGGELHFHDRIDHRCGDKIVPVDAAVDDEGTADDGGIFAGSRQCLRMQRNFERSRHIDDIDIGNRPSERAPLAEEGAYALVDDIGVPTGADDCDLILLWLNSDCHFWSFKGHADVIGKVASQAA
jgi:hypothetical protein